ncbi:MAG: YbgC/FadM family acyl-CoA thioesterase [Campylobacteraceae bacterium]|jgi:acyl-CoA thioester hydrolase|nr:YbgC/FadM family acyl-CoA thioesterase [Campylobacteraceae bacterium]
MNIRIYYEDTDALGIVYHTNYIKYCDRARSELFFESDIDMKSEKGALVIRSINANYMQPAYLGDMLKLGGYISILKKTSVLAKQFITRNGIKIFEMDIRLVYVENGKPAIMPDKYYNLFLKNFKKD